MDVFTQPHDELVKVIADDTAIQLQTADGVVLSLPRDVAVAAARRVLHVAGADVEEDIYQKPWG